MSISLLATKHRDKIIVGALFVSLRALAVFHGPDADVQNFFSQASAAIEGNRPYTDFGFEYPPGALLLMVLPRLLTADLPTYSALFMIEMALLELLILVGLARIVPRMRSPGAPRTEARDVFFTLVTYVICTGLLGGVLLLQRLDLALGALLLWFLLSATRQRPEATTPWTGPLLLAAGIWIKLVPLVLLPLMMLHRYRLDGSGGRSGGQGLLRWLVASGWRAPAQVCAALVILWLPFLLISGTDAAGFLGYQTARGLQIESSYGSMLLVLRHVLPVKVAVVHLFGAWQVDSSVAPAVATLSTWLIALGQGLVLRWYLRVSANTAADAQPQLLARACLVSLLALMLTSKVFSPQFLLWVAPLLALFAGPLRQDHETGGGRVVPLLLSAFVLTGVYTRLLYGQLLKLRVVPALVVLLRNLLLAALVLALCRAPRPIAQQPRHPHNRQR